MKKILFAAMALVTISFASCNGCASKLDEIQKAADSVSAIVDSANAELDEANAALDTLDAADDSVEAFVEE